MTSADVGRRTKPSGVIRERRPTADSLLSADLKARRAGLRWQR